MKILNKIKGNSVAIFLAGGFFAFGLTSPAHAQFDYLNYIDYGAFVNDVIAADGYDPGAAAAVDGAGAAAAAAAADAAANAAAAVAAGDGSTVNGLTAEQWLEIAAAEAGQSMCMGDGYGDAYCSTIAAPIVTRDDQNRITQIVCGNGTVFNFSYGGGGTPPVEPPLVPPTCADYNMLGDYPTCYVPDPGNATCADYNMSGIYPDCFTDVVVVDVPTCAEAGLSGEYPYCFTLDPPTTDPTCADYGLDGVYPDCSMMPPPPTPPAMTLKICENSCSSSFEPPANFLMTQGSTKSLVACYNSAVGCTDASGNVTSWAIWSENTSSNVVTLTSANPKLLTATQNGTEGISASYGGQTVNRVVTVTCVDGGACQRDSRSQSLCAADTFTTTDSCGATVTCNGSKSCDYNWKEVTPN